MKIDDDLKQMTPAQLRREAMRLRVAFIKELTHTGDHRCWAELLLAIYGKALQPLALSKKVFLSHCDRYFDRNQPRLKNLSKKARTLNARAVAKALKIGNK